MRGIPTINTGRLLFMRREIALGLMSEIVMNAALFSEARSITQKDSVRFYGEDGTANRIWDLGQPALFPRLGSGT